MKIFDTLVCTLSDLRYVIIDYLDGGHGKKNPLPIEVVEEVKRNINDFIRDFKPYQKSNDPNNTQIGSIWYADHEDLYLKIRELHFNKKLTTAELASCLAKLLDLPELCSCNEKNIDIKFSGAELFGPNQGIVHKTTITLCRLTQEREKVEFQISLKNDSGEAIALSESYPMRKGEHIYVTALDYVGEQDFVFCDLVNTTRKRSNMSICFTEKNTENIGSILRSEDISPIPNVVSADIIDNGDILYITNDRKLYSMGKLANELRPKLVPSSESLVYVKSYDDFVLTLSAEGTLIVVNILTRKIVLVDQNVYWTRFISNGSNVLLETRHFEKDRDDVMTVLLN